MRLPVALELLELLATVNIPQPDRLVIRTDELRWIRRVEPDGIDVTAAIVSNVSLLVTSLRLSPGERGRAAGKIVTLTVLPAMAQNKQVSGGDKKKKAWLTCGPRASSDARPCLGPTE